MYPIFKSEYNAKVYLFILHFKYPFILSIFPKLIINKTKTNEEGLDKKENHLNYTTVRKYAFCFLVWLFFNI